MRAFGSDLELVAFFTEQARIRETLRETDIEGNAMTLAEAPADMPATTSASGAAAADTETFSANIAPPAPAKPAGDESITNTQEAAVDEGGIVKSRGDLLIVLRRGRLFTVSTAGGGMRPVDHIDAVPPGAEPDGWYDEMLVAGDRIAVVGYSYARGGTEINRFRLSPDGRLSFLDSHILRSADYYSSRNYASRLIGHRMIFYSALPLGGGVEAMKSLPGLRRWTPGAPEGEGEFTRIAAARRIYAPPQVRDTKDLADILHTVTNCDLLAEPFDCEATAVLGPWSRSFYVSGQAVWLWVGGDAWGRSKRQPQLLYRMPLDGSAPSAIEVAGAPIDQFSFREADGRLQVLVARDGDGDGMWFAERSKPRQVALLTLPLDRLNDGSASAPPEAYRTLPTPGAGWTVHNRFVGDRLLYGLGADWQSRGGDRGLLLAAPLDGGPVASIPLPHPVDRIEVMGPDAVVIGSGAGSVWFSTVALDGPATAGDRYRLGGAAEAESRSHGFFYRPDSAEGREGVLGLPVTRAARPAWRQLFETSAALTFLRRADHQFRPLGQLTAREEGFSDDGCIASCVDWYGNARPIFLRGRVYALLGYELVEGRIEGGAIREVGRVDFTPSSKR